MFARRILISVCILQELLVNFFWPLWVYVFPDYNSQRNYKGESGGKQSKDRTSNSTYNQSELSNPCYYSSSIYYGGQEVYSPNTPAKTSHHAVSDDNLYIFIY